MAQVTIDENNNKVTAYSAGDFFKVDAYPDGTIELYTVGTIDEGTDTNLLLEAYDIDDVAKTCDVRNLGYLEITTDATDSGAPVDGILDIIADGVADCTIMITKKKGDGTTDTDATSTIYLTTTGGKLDSNTLTLSSGVATATLTSVDEQKVVELEAVDPAGILKAVKFQMQFK